jgi:hypothetical protein
MYFATLTEVPILVIAGELGWKKTLTNVGLVAAFSTVAGMLFGALP